MKNILFWKVRGSILQPLRQLRRHHPRVCCAAPTKGRRKIKGSHVGVSCRAAKGAPAQRVRDCLFTTLPSFASQNPPPLTQGRLYKDLASYPESAAQPPYRGGLRLCRPPCAKGDVFAYAKTGGLFLSRLLILLHSCPPWYTCRQMKDRDGKSSPGKCMKNKPGKDRQNHTEHKKDSHNKNNIPFYDCNT